ncbi:putative odorant receptor 83c [Wyeomyia smithii]|uniref:putative odorant receptor 83c n=1 Tax=Wyeomyia smithii TaxID=174621 RepID=UPI0024680A7C|nr:putative odorant receptor 83c [Wyeomyia smithii]
MDLIQKMEQYKLFRHSFDDPAEFCAQIIATPNKISKLIGLDIFSAGYSSRNFNTIFTLFVAIFYLYLTFTSVYNMRHDVENVINCLVTLGVAIQCVWKLFTFAIYRKKLIWMHEYNISLFKEECNPRTRNMLMRNIFVLSAVLKVMLISYAFTSFSLDFAPLLYLAMTGAKLLPFGFFIPYLNQNSWSGYIINYVVHVILTVYVSSGDMGLDCIYMTILMNSFTQIDLLVISLHEMNEMIEQDCDNIKPVFEKIVRRHQEHLQYLRTVENVFRFFYFVTFVSLSSVLVTSLFAVVMLSWYQGYVFIAFVSYQMFFGCFLGTMLELKSEQLQREIYNILWYKLETEQQMPLRFMLMSAQESVTLTVIFGKLNIPTFLQVYKTVYSIFTMLQTVKVE